MVLSIPLMLPRNLPITTREPTENTTAAAATTTQPSRLAVMEKEWKLLPSAAPTHLQSEMVLSIRPTQ